MRKEERAEACRAMLARNHTYAEISHVLKMTSATIAAIARGEPGYKEAGPGRPPKVTREIKRFVYVNWVADSTITDATMTCMVNDHFKVRLGISTIRGCRQALGFQYRPPKASQDLTPEQKELRVEFCRRIVAHAEEMPNVIFSDESRFQIGPDNQWRRIKRGVWNSTCFASRTKFPHSVMVWGAIGRGFRSKLVMCSNSEGTAEYLQILENSDLISEADRIYGRGRWYFLQDGAPCHQSKQTMEWFNDNQVRLVPGWPPNSPDLNPIEMVWGVMKRQLRWHGKKMSKAEMFMQLAGVWHDLADATLDSLASSFVRRCEMVLAVDGESISGYLSSHRRPEPVATSVYRSWTADEDDRLRDLVRQHGPRWKAMGQWLSRSPASCKHRWRCLEQIARNQSYPIPDHEVLPPIQDIPFVWKRNTTIDGSVPSELDNFLRLFSDS